MIVAGAEAPKDGEFYPCRLYLDTSQDAKRHAVLEGCLRSICSGSCFYSFAHDRQVESAEHLLFMGWAQAVVEEVMSPPDGLKQTAIRDLSGEAMGAPCVALALCALILSLGEGVWNE